jgi:hypothetical protein
MAAIKSAPRAANIPAIQHITRIRYRADASADLRVTTINAPKIEIIARIENVSMFYPALSRGFSIYQPELS